GSGQTICTGTAESSVLKTTRFAYRICLSIVRLSRWLRLTLRSTGSSPCGLAPVTLAVRPLRLFGLLQPPCKMDRARSVRAVRAPCSGRLLRAARSIRQAEGARRQARLHAPPIEASAAVASGMVRYNRET